MSYAEVITKKLNDANNKFLNEPYSDENEDLNVLNSFMYSENYKGDDVDLKNAVYMDNYGGEGQGDDFWSVYKFVNKETEEVVYIKFRGFYSSYNGAEYENFEVVKPVEKTITVYE